jgi:endonuclease YncB( thermonuclease family)
MLERIKAPMRILAAWVGKMTQFGRRATLLVATLTIVWPLLGRADATGCEETGAAPVEIARITDELDIVLKDDRIIRLVGIKAPARPDAAGQPDAKLVSWITEAAADTPVTVRVLSPLADRWGRLAGDVFLGGRHLQSALALAGLAVARPDDLRGPCWEAVKAAEAKGRSTSSGLWADPASILPATDGAKIGEHEGMFVLALGRVRHVSRAREGRGRSYVDFGKRGENALFLTVDAKALIRMEKQGFKLEQLISRKILARGVVMKGRSPHMVIDDVDAIEFWD